jgi:hypothetical protein
MSYNLRDQANFFDPSISPTVSQRARPVLIDRRPRRAMYHHAGVPELEAGVRALLGNSSRIVL